MGRSIARREERRLDLRPFARVPASRQLGLVACLREVRLGRHRLVGLADPPRLVPSVRLLLPVLPPPLPPLQQLHAGTSLYAAPRTVSSCAGWVGSRSILRLRLEMCTSQACSSPTCSLAHRCCMSSRRETTASDCSARSERTLNSDSVRWTRSPS